jgi:hypothetical protein
MILEVEDVPGSGLSLTRDLWLSLYKAEFGGLSKVEWAL